MKEKREEVESKSFYKEEYVKFFSLYEIIDIKDFNDKVFEKEEMNSHPLTRSKYEIFLKLVMNYKQCPIKISQFEDLILL